MEKKKSNAKREARAECTRRSSISKAGDGTVEVQNLEKAKALEDIQQIFSDVAREYPEFLEDNEILQQQQQQDSGDGYLATTVNFLGRRMRHSESVSTGQSPSIKEGLPFQGVLSSASTEPLKQVTSTFVQYKNSIPFRKSGFPPLPVGPSPKQKQGIKPLKPELLEIFSRKSGDNTSGTFPNTSTTADTPSSSVSRSTTGIVAEIVRRTEVNTETETETTGSHFDRSTIRYPATLVSTSTQSSRNPPSNKFPVPLPLDREDSIPKASKIRMATSIRASKWPVNKNGPVVKTAYTPLYGRLSTVPEQVEHNDFADEFIKSLELKGEQFERAQKKQAEHLIHLPVNDEDTPLVDPTKPPPLDALNSLKLVHKYPIWPHQVPLHKTLSHLPSLKSLVLDDSEINWLRDLGSFLPNLITLSVMRCNLTTLDGTFGFPNLENLFAADNRIISPVALSCLEHIRYVDLSGNPIKSFEGFHFLRGCSNLKCLKLTDTEIGKYPNFHTEMRRLIPSIRELQPKITDLNGRHIFNDENVQSGSLVANSDTEPCYDYKVQRELPWSSESAVSGSGTSNLPIATSILKEVKRVNWIDCLPSTSEENEDQEIDSMTEEMVWRNEEKRLREVYIPGRTEFRKRGPAVIPVGIDEMDAFLDEIEGTNNLEVVKAAFARNNESMSPIGQGQFSPDETTDQVSNLPSSRGEISDSSY